MNSAKFNKKYFLLFSLLGVVLFLVFLYLAYSVLKQDLFGTQQKSTNKTSVYRTSTGEEVFYDSESVTEEEIKKIIEEQKKYRQE